MERFTYDDLEVNMKWLFIDAQLIEVEHPVALLACRRGMFFMPNISKVNYRNTPSIVSSDTEISNKC